MKDGRSHDLTDHNGRIHQTVAFVAQFDAERDGPACVNRDRNRFPTGHGGDRLADANAGRELTRVVGKQCKTRIH